MAACEPAPAEPPPAGVADVPSPQATPEPDAPLRSYADEDLEVVAPQAWVGWPTESVYLTSYFGWRIDPVTGRGTRLHRGIDLRGRPGDLVMTIADGTVRFAGHDHLLGNMVVVDHGLGIESYYGHLTDVLVHEGLPVQRGSAIGLVGNTGRSAAPHLHLSIKIGGVPVDPLALIRHPLHPAPALARELEAPENRGSAEP